MTCKATRPSHGRHACPDSPHILLRYSVFFTVPSMRQHSLRSHTTTLLHTLTCLSVEVLSLSAVATWRLASRTACAHTTASHPRLEHRAVRRDLRSRASISTSVHVRHSTHLLQSVRSRTVCVCLCVFMWTSIPTSCSLCRSEFFWLTCWLSLLTSAS